MKRTDGFHQKKALGQNFLTDETLLEGLCLDAGVTPEDCVLEIGPGMGALTRPLSQVARRVVSVEIDRDLIGYLEAAFAGQDNVRIINEDILRVNIEKLIAEEFGVGASVRVAANLPYYITSDILKGLLAQRLPFRSIAVMVQKEVGDKMTATAGSENYGPLALLCQYRGRVYEARRIGAAYFTPKPKVDSSFMRIDLYDAPPVDVQDEKLFFKVVRAAFTMRRKTLVNNLNASFALPRDVATALVESCGYDARVRGEVLDMDGFARVSDAISAIRSAK